MTTVDNTGIKLDEATDNLNGLIDFAQRMSEENQQMRLENQEMRKLFDARLRRLEG
jgi:regulator of replication initiation timing